MKTTLIVVMKWSMLGWMLLLATPVDAADPGKPWKVAAWRQVPAMRWLDQSGPIHSLLYQGEMYRGQPTETFAFYASPDTLGEAEADAKFPGVVLIHGGGGTAFAEWVWLWAKRGYAAIAMDLSGHRPVDPIYDPTTGAPVLNQAVKRELRTKLDRGGPDQGHSEKFDSIGSDLSEQWPFHAVANVMLAHSLLRDFPEVDARRTAVTGISWGGYTTCLVASLDDRFQAAVPVYGCGFLHAGESVQKPSIDRLAERRQDWIDTYDPGSLLIHCRVPILFVNGTNDVHYPLDSYQKSFDAVPGSKHMRIEVKMGHSHPAGWAPREIGLFIDSYCRQGMPLPEPGTLTVLQDKIVLAYRGSLPLKSAMLHYTTDDGLRSARSWQAMPCRIDADQILAPKPPAEANTWFISLTDERDAMSTTPVQFRGPSASP